jgi:hypothetical protein
MYCAFHDKFRVIESTLYHSDKLLRQQFSNALFFVGVVEQVS